MSASSKKSVLSSVWFWIGIIVLVASDLWTKEWAWQYYGKGIQPVLGSWLSWQTVHNPGGIFGMGQSFTVALTVIRLFAVGLILVMLHRQSINNKSAILTLSLLVAGAIGNLYDNLSSWMPWSGNGEVRDFIRVYIEDPSWWPTSIPWPFSPWPIFNLADSFICVGFVLLISGIAVIQLNGSEDQQESENE